ncbi:hypothetical protein [Paenibacillus chibensis]|uniref:hypothetical protein n=1 Tax=Paenibacillus chibensis TaxID=59846 RepID=UPI0013E40915|nr:hypothetical protein [Paenibacillus chibensis]MEC0370615.1 hypothetical protein [Paenibacillus chibensis]
MYVVVMFIFMLFILLSVANIDTTMKKKLKNDQEILKVLEDIRDTVKDPRRI